jgi:hypothetical protein
VERKRAERNSNQYDDNEETIGGVGWVAAGRDVVRPDWVFVEAVVWSDNEGAGRGEVMERGERGGERILVEEFVWRMKRLEPKDLIYEVFQHAGDSLRMHGQPGREETRTNRGKR